MPVHDWTRVDAGIFHAFHHDWITDVRRVLPTRLNLRRARRWDAK